MVQARAIIPLACLALAPPLTTAQAGWKPLGQIDIGTPNSLIWDPTDKATLFAGYDELYRSTDGGQSWSVVPTPEATYGISGIVRDTGSNALTITGANQFAARSTDLGASWYYVPGLYAGTFTPDPKVKRRVWETTGALYRTDDGGADWTEVPSFNISDPVALDAHAQQSLYAVPGISCAIYRSTDAAQTFTQVYDLSFSSGCLRIPSIAAIPASGQIFAAQTKTGTAASLTRVVTSKDQGASWTALDTGIAAADTIRKLQVDFTTPSAVYAVPTAGGTCPLYALQHGTSWSCSRPSGLRSVTGLASSSIGGGSLAYGSGALARTTNGGKSWTAAKGSGLPSSALTGLLGDAQGKVLYAASDAGVSRSADAGLHWSALAALPAPLAGQPVQVLLDTLATPDRLYVSGTAGAWSSSDGGKSFTPITIVKDPTGTLVVTLGLLQTSPTVAGRLYAYYSVQGGSTPGSAIAQSSDYGKTWHIGALPQGEIEQLAADPTTKNLLYALTGNGFFKSTDLSHWQYLDGEIGGAKSGVALLKGSPTAVIATIYDYSIDRYVVLASRNAGRSFVRTGIELDDQPQLAAFPESAVAAVEGYDDETGETAIYASKDRGITFHAVTGQGLDFDTLVSVWPTATGLIAETDTRPYVLPYSELK